MSILQNFPSLTSIFQNAWNTCKRFPFAMLSAMSATTFALILSESDNKLSDPFIQKLLLVSLLGLPLFIALKMFADKYDWNYNKSLILQTIGLCLLLLYYFLTPEKFFHPDKHIIQYALLFICFLFLNAFLPYLKGKNIQGFWQYNKTMFLGYLTSMLYSHVMGLGLIIALAAMDNLFNMEIDEKRYFQIWIIASILFNAWVFMSKLPTDLKLLENDKSYPNGLKMFIQYILLPLVGLYLFILYAYEAKIIIEWNWPIGWVSNLVLCFSVVSILSLLLLYPLQKLNENKWIQVFSKWFFRALIPLVAMLFMAIIERISQYGITEPRYFVFAMAVGLAVVVLYFVISKSKDIRIIPIIIAILAFISALGPWSASSVSKSSQQNRLESLLITNNLLLDGNIVTPNEALDFDSRKEMSSIVDYLLSLHGVELFEMWLDDSVILAINKNDADTNNGVVSDPYTRTASTEKICNALGFEFESQWSSEDNEKYFNLETDRMAPINISGYNTYYKFINNFENNEPQRFVIDSLDCFIKYDQNNAAFALYISDSISTIDDLGEINLTDTLKTLHNIYGKKKLPNTDLSFNFIGKQYEAKIVFSRISCNSGELFIITTFDAILLLKEK